MKCESLSSLLGGCAFDHHGGRMLLLRRLINAGSCCQPVIKLLLIHSHDQRIKNVFILTGFITLMAAFDFWFFKNSCEFQRQCWPIFIMKMLQLLITQFSYLLPTFFTHYYCLKVCEVFGIWQIITILEMGSFDKVDCKRCPTPHSPLKSSLKSHLAAIVCLSTHHCGCGKPGKPYLDVFNFTNQL